MQILGYTHLKTDFNNYAPTSSISKYGFFRLLKFLSIR